MLSPGDTLKIGSTDFEIIKDTRLREGMVVRSGDIYGRVGPKDFIQEEQAHTMALHDRGFPVPRVLGSGELPDGNWYFSETSLGDEPFHKAFNREYTKSGVVSDPTFQSYLEVMRKYFRAQVDENNRTTIAPEDFIHSLIPDDDVIPNYSYFGHDTEKYVAAREKAADKLSNAPMGILQYDLNPYNILSGGIIDFELVGDGPIGYDILMSARWGGTWFTSYPSRYPCGYKLSSEQLSEHDNLVSTIAAESGLSDPSLHLQDFLLLKCAWAVSETLSPQPDWPQDKIAFRRFRANVLRVAVDAYLADEPIDSMSLSDVPGGELSQGR